MITATSADRHIVIDILTSSFDTNKSVNYIIKQDNHKVRRIQRLMDYAFHMCLRFGHVFLSDDKKGCALMIYPEKKQNTFQTLIWNLKLAFFSIGITNLPKTVKRESEIKKRHPTDPFTYLWFIGVFPAAQGGGIGSLLLDQVLHYSKTQQRNVFLETSTQVNLPWYEKFGFRKYDELDLGYRLFFLKWT